MPELPDVVAYVEALQPRVVGVVVRRVRVVSPFVLRTFEPPIESIEGRAAVGVGRLGKRVVFEFAGDLFLVIHPMIAGRFRWFDDSQARSPAKITLARIDFERGAVVLTEASQKKRASMHVVSGAEGVLGLAPVGVELLDPEATHTHRLKTGATGGGAAREIGAAEFAAILRRGNNTLKRALTDPRRFSGIGNAYSDEILHAARLSPVMLTYKLSDDEAARLLAACRGTLSHWIDALRREFAGRFPGPGEITAFRPEFAVHGRFGAACPVCGTAVQRIRYADNETNYCPTCQTGGKVLADRSLSRLLKQDWPRTVEELE